MRRFHILAALAVTVAFLGHIRQADAGDISGKLSAKRAKYAKNAVVYLEGASGKYSAPAKPVQMDQKNQTFIPFVLPVLVGTTVQFLNNDNTGHNVFSPDGEKYDLGNWGKGESRTYKFEKKGVYTQLCKMHPSMIAYVVVLDNPHFAVTGSDGSFVIKDVPAGEYTVKVWHERKKAAPSKVTVPASGDVQIELRIGK
jgi:plastocyanin